MKEKGRGRDDGKGEREVKEKGREGEVKEKERGEQNLTTSKSE